VVGWRVRRELLHARTAVHHGMSITREVLHCMHIVHRGATVGGEVGLDHVRGFVVTSERDPS
jgi:hypothetical protein